MPAPDSTFVVISQVYPPDPTSVGQHIRDVAVEMARRGHRVVAYTANRGYNDPQLKFARRETVDGVEIRRLPLSAFGKSSMALRILGGLSFTLQAALRSLFIPRLRLMLVSTSPPMAGLAAVIVGALRRVDVTFWAMDLNPDQMVVMGAASPRSLSVRAFDWLNRRILNRSRTIVALDRFMAERISRKTDVTGKLLVMPPWPHEDHLEPVAHENNPFRKAHGLDGKTVIMYSGNHSTETPLTTMIEAARRVEDLTDLVFMFIGGGTGKRAIDEMIARENPPNIRSLPYQPIDQLRYSLSAADVHLVSVREEFVGICHPCKVYGSMAASRPILSLGPRPSHVSDILDDGDLGWNVGHGDVDGAERLIREIHRTAASQRMSMGRRAREIVDQKFTMDSLLKRFCDAVEHGVQEAPSGPPAIPRGQDASHGPVGVTL